MTASRMRTFAAGRVMACVLLIAVVLMAGCIAFGYRIGQVTASEAAYSGTGVGNPFDVKRPEGRVVVDRIGDLSSRLTRLEIEAEDLARRLGISSETASLEPAPGDRTKDDRPRGGPLLPFGGDLSIAAVHDPVTDDLSLSHLESEVELLEASLDRTAGVLADRDLATMAYPNRLPVPGRTARISSEFGVRQDPFTGRLARHMGLDIPAAHGTAVLASGGGRVISAGFRGPYGNAIVIDHGHGLQTLYGHCSKLYVRVGELVMPRQKIAAVGSTGRSTGPHLHFEVIRNGQRVAPGQVLASVLARDSD
jgi:murein DD-endopeptidase MepM/ murein hydrolase activator NlpD